MSTIKHYPTVSCYENHLSQMVLAEHKKCFTHLNTHFHNAKDLIPLLFQERQNLGKMSTAAENELANGGNYSRLASPKQKVSRLVLVTQENVEFILKYLKS